MNTNELDFQKLHLAPKPVQFLLALIVAILMLVAGYFVMFQEQWDTLSSAKEKETTLRDDYTKLAQEAKSLETLKAELKSIDSSISDLIKQLPTSSEIPTLIQELYQAGASNNLTMSAVIPKPIVREDDNIQRLPFLITVTGTYEQLSEFLRDVGKMSRIVTLSSVTITHPDENGDSKDPKNLKNKNKLTLSAVASTYKAVDAPPQSASAASEASAASGATDSQSQ